MRLAEKSWGSGDLPGRHPAPEPGAAQFSSRSSMYSWTQGSLGLAQTCLPFLVWNLQNKEQTHQNPVGPLRTSDTTSLACGRHLSLLNHGSCQASLVDAILLEWHQNHTPVTSTHWIYLWPQGFPRIGTRGFCNQYGYIFPFPSNDLSMFFWSSLRNLLISHDVFDCS